MNLESNANGVVSKPLKVSGLDEPDNGTDSSNNPTATGADFKSAMLRLLRNKLFMYNFFSSIFYVFAFMGFGTFMPKYIEYNFRIKSSKSSSLAGGLGR